MQKEYHFNRLENASSSTVLQYEDHVLRICKGKESKYPTQQALITVEIYQPIAAFFTFSSAYSDFDKLKELVSIATENDDSKPLFDFCFQILMRDLSSHEKMLEFVKDISKDSYEDGWKDGRNDLRKNLNTLMKMEY